MPCLAGASQRQHMASVSPSVRHARQAHHHQGVPIAVRHREERVRLAPGQRSRVVPIGAQDLATNPPFIS